MFIVAGSDQIRSTSADGRSWGRFEIGAKQHTITSVLVAGGKAIATVRRGGSVFLDTSSDGKNWKLIEISSKEYRRRMGNCIYANGQFVLFGGHAGKVKNCPVVFQTSADGAEWSEIIEYSAKGGMVRNMVFGNGRFVGVGDRGLVATMPADLSSFNQVEGVRAIDTMVDVTFGNGVFVGVGLHGLRRWSEDGETWSEPVHGREGEHVNSVEWTGSHFIGSGAGVTFISSDGRSWEQHKNVNAPTFFTHHDGDFVGISYKGRVFHSKNAIDWELGEKVDTELRCIGAGEI